MVWKKNAILPIQIYHFLLFAFIQLQSTKTEAYFRVTWDISTSICTQERGSILAVLILQLKGVAEFLKQNTNFLYVKFLHALMLFHKDVVLELKYIQMANLA